MRAVEGVAAKVGRTLDPFQRDAVDVLTSSWADGRPAALESAICASRQNVKTFAFECIALTSMTRPNGPKLVVWSAHEVATAQESFRTFLDLAERFTWLGDRITGVTRSPGREAIQFIGKRWLRFRARIKTGGRGLAGDEIFLDEAFALEPAHMGSLLPILSTRKYARVYYGSSAPLATSGILRSVIQRGRAGGSGAPAYVEWSAPGSMSSPGCKGAHCSHEPGTPGCAMDDERLWMMANPAAVVGRISLDYLRAERRALPPEEFARERLGWGEEPGTAAPAPISQITWSPLKVTHRTPPEGVPTFGISVAPNLRSAAISAAVSVGNVVHVELADHRSGHEWLAARCADLRKKHPDARFVTVSTGAVASLLPDLIRADAEPDQKTLTDLARAYGHLEKRVKDRTLSHSGAQGFKDALAGAVKRDVGEGLWSLAWRKSGADLAPIESAALAVWTLSTDESDGGVSFAFS